MEYHFKCIKSDVSEVVLSFEIYKESSHYKNGLE